MKRIFTLIVVLLVSISFTKAQPCTPQGDETSFGTNDTWIGYVYDNSDFTSYLGFVNEGTAGNPDFDQSFGGDNNNFATNGCSVYTESFTVRYKLNKNFADNSYQVTVGGDDGYRFSIDGGATWVIDNWGDHAYASTTQVVALNGDYDLVIEFYENGGQNRINFNIQPVCVGTSNQSDAGSNNVWIGHVYDGTNFNIYKGTITGGISASPNFDESFGGDNVTLNTSECSTTTETFSVRYRLTKTFLSGDYIFTVGADDGYRLSFDGGATWPINQWGDQSYTTSTYSATLSGTYDLILEYYENGGGNRVSFNMTTFLLPVSFLNFSADKKDNAVNLNWQTATESNNEYFIIQRSANGADYTEIGRVNSKAFDGNSTSILSYNFTDKNLINGNTFYRLVQVDKDGRNSFSKVVSIAYSSTKLQVFPNPVSSGQVFVQPPANKKINSVSMYDAAGKMIYNKRIPSPSSGTTLTIRPEKNIPSGYYMLVMDDGNESINSPIWWIQ